MKNIYFITVNFNNANYTLKYIESIMKLAPSSFRVDVTIVDNASDREDYDKLERERSEWRNVRLIRNANNLGYFRALNIGITSLDRENQGKGKKGSLFVVGNNDIEFQKDFLSELEKIRYDDRTLVLAPDVVTWDGYHQNPHCIQRVSTLRKVGYKLYFMNYTFGRFIYWLMQKKKRIKYNKIKIEHSIERYIHMGIGACYILTEHFFKYYDKLDESVFLWGEEALLAGQVNVVGGKTLYNPNIVVYHSEGKTIGKIPTKKIYQISRESYKIYSKYL